MDLFSLAGAVGLALTLERKELFMTDAVVAAITHAKPPPKWSAIYFLFSQCYCGAAFIIPILGGVKSCTQ